MFSPNSVGCLFVLLMVSFAVQKLLSLSVSHLFISAFISFALGDRFKKKLLWFTSKSNPSMFSPRSCLVPGLTFRSLLHLKSTFLYGDSVCVCSVTQLCLTLCNPVGWSLPSSSVHGIILARMLEYHFLLQGIFLTQGWNLHLLWPLTWQVNSLSQSHLESRISVKHLTISLLMWPQAKCCIAVATA